jgi:hypothetical protein
MERFEDGQRIFVTRAVRTNPFLELQFSPPVMDRSLRGRRLRVYCAEVGAYAPPGGQTWTIAKGCQPRSMP